MPKLSSEDQLHIHVLKGNFAKFSAAITTRPSLAYHVYAGKTLLWLAVFNGAVEVLQAAIESGVDLEFVAGYETNRCFIDAAAFGGHVALMQMILDAGFDVNSEKTRVLINALCFHENEDVKLEMVKLCIDSGCDLNRRYFNYTTETYFTALEFAHGKAEQLIREEMIKQKGRRK